MTDISKCCNAPVKIEMDNIWSEYLKALSDCYDYTELANFNAGLAAEACNDTAIYAEETVYFIKQALKNTRDIIGEGT